MSKPLESDVLVVGAGPVGLFTALCLADRGIRVQLVDMYRRTALHSYALALHPESLRMFDALGLADALIERGNRVDRIVVHRAGSEVAQLDLAAIRRGFPFLVLLPQSILEGLLEQKLAEAGVEIHWGHQLMSFDVGDAAVDALVARTDEGHAAEPRVETFHFRASYLIGADGFASSCRRIMGLELENAGPALTFGLLEFEPLAELPSEIHLDLGETASRVLWPIDARRGRWSAQLHDSDAAVDIGELKRQIGEACPWFDNFGPVEWVTSVRFQPRLCRTFGRQRVWLAGDAAHTASPLGVQSMNVGFREGRDLARAIAGILREGRSDKRLLYYQDDRLREWKMLLGIKQQLRNLPDSPRWIRGIERQLVASLPASGRDLNVLLGQAGLQLLRLRRSADRPPLESGPGSPNV